MHSGTILFHDPLDGSTILQPADGGSNLITIIDGSGGDYPPGTTVQYTTVRTGRGLSVIIHSASVP